MVFRRNDCNPYTIYYIGNIYVETDKISNRIHENNSNKKNKYDVTWILTTVTTTTGLFKIHMYPGVGFVFQQLEMKKKN